jgi:hypothetical protein
MIANLEIRPLMPSESDLELALAKRRYPAANPTRPKNGGYSDEGP